MNLCYHLCSNYQQGCYLFDVIKVVSVCGTTTITLLSSNIIKNNNHFLIRLIIYITEIESEFFQELATVLSTVTSLLIAASPAFSTLSRTFVPTAGHKHPW